MMSGAGVGLKRTARDGEWVMSTLGQAGPREQMEAPLGVGWQVTLETLQWQSWSQEAGLE